MFKIIHALSGGIDSTSTLLQLVDKVYEVKLLHLKLCSDLKNTRWMAEAKSVKNILKWFEDNRNIKFDFDYGQVVNMDAMFDIEICAFAISNQLRKNPDFRHVSLSTSADDRIQEFWEYRHNSRIQITTVLTQRKIDWVAPNWNKKKRASNC